MNWTLLANLTGPIGRNTAGRLATALGISTQELEAQLLRCPGAYRDARLGHIHVPHTMSADVVGRYAREKDIRMDRCTAAEWTRELGRLLREFCEERPVSNTRRSRTA